MTKPDLSVELFMEVLALFLGPDDVHDLVVLRGTGRTLHVILSVTFKTTKKTK